jgi:DNA (cytosine-5)-methyltransferase 1
MKVGSLFSGIGGLDLGLERAGMGIAWQCEIDRHCCTLLARHWPSVRLLGGVRNLVHERNNDTPAIDVICGGDPCPCRSRARGDRPSAHPDLSGYFLAVAGRLRPRWVVRENVPAPDVQVFSAGLVLLGYEPVVVELDSAGFTGQRRIRQFCIGCPGTEAARRLRHLLDAAGDPGAAAARRRPTAALTACLTAHAKRVAAEDTYVFEDGRGLRILTAPERELLQGFPAGWTAGLSHRRRCELLGNAVTVPVAEFIGRLILQVEEDTTP